MQKCRISGAKSVEYSGRGREFAAEKSVGGGEEGEGEEPSCFQLDWGTHSLIPVTFLNLVRNQNSYPVISTRFPNVTVGKTENKARSRQGKRINSAFIFGERKVAKVGQ